MNDHDEALPMRLYFTPEDVERALEELGPTATYAEGLVKTAALAAVHVMRGGLLSARPRTPDVTTHQGLHLGGRDRRQRGRVGARGRRSRRVGVSAAPLTLGLVAEDRYPISRAWAMPNPETFSIPPIAAFIERWWREPSVDPFARNSMLATYRNDLAPSTAAEWHMEAVEFCDWLARPVELVMFDPPYSPRQIAEVYQSIGRQATTRDTQNARLYKEVRDELDRLLVRGGIALSFGWNSAGFGKARGYDVVEILLVAHGGAHNDTICVAERKR